jgi:FSR family fosmidomycin resistance protein-like MFS transporter
MLAVCVVVASIGTSFFHPVAAATVGRLAPHDRRGRWMGLYETAGWGGTVVGPLAIGLTIDRLGPAGIWPVVLPALALALIAIRLTPSGPTVSPNPATVSGSITPASGPALGQSRLGFLGLFTTVGSLRAWVYYSAALLLPLLGHEIGLGASGAAQVLTVFLAAGVLGSLACGTASDRLGARWIIAGALLLAIPIGLGLGLGQPSGPMLYVVAAASGFLLTGAYTGLTLAGQQRLPDNAGMVTGLNVGLTSGIGGLAVVPLASLADDIGIRSAVALALTIGPLLAVAIWLLATGRERRA